MAHLEPGTPLHDDEKSKDITRNKDEPKLSLDEFVATHTSEDNESFQEIMNDAFERHKKRVRKVSYSTISANVGFSVEII